MKFLKTLVLCSFIILVAEISHGQTIIQQSQLFTATTVATVQPTVPEFSLFPLHNISVVTTGTAVGTVQLQTCTTTLASSCSAMTGSSAVSVATCTVVSPCTQTVEALTQAFGAFTITLSTCTSCSVSVTYQAAQYLPTTNLLDGVYNVPLGACGAALTTGAYAANPANSGALSAPSMVRVAAGQQMLQVTTSGAASALTVDCDLTPPSRLTAGRGVTVTGYNFFYGIQTTALSSITTPVVNTVTFPVPPSATPVGTVAAAGGTITIAPVAPTLTTTTLGQCNGFNATFATPVLLNSSNVKLETTVVLNQAAASAAVYQVCGVQVLYQNNPL